MPSNRIRCAIVALILTLAAGVPCRAQEARGTILGRLTDSSGAVVAGVTIQVTNEATKVSVPLTSNQQGNYQALYLLPSSYTVTASAPGFKSFVRSGIELRVDDRLEVNIVMEVGAVTESVTVSGETPLLETANASLGDVVDSRRVADLPFANGNPFNLMQLAAGVNYVGRPPVGQLLRTCLDRVLRNGRARAATAAKCLWTALSNTATTAQGAVVTAYVPPADVVGEFKGANGDLRRQRGPVRRRRNQRESEIGRKQIPRHRALGSRWPHSGTRTNSSANRSGVPRGEFDYNRWGASGTGPIYIPKLYNGRNRTFYTYGYEGIHQSRPRGSTLTVPTAAPTRGRLFRPAGSRQAVSDLRPLYAAARAANGRFEADPLPNNIIAKIAPERAGAGHSQVLPAADRGRHR